MKNLNQGKVSRFSINCSRAVTALFAGLFLLVFSFSTSAQIQHPNIEGPWAVAFSGHNSFCTLPGDNGNFSGTGTLTNSNQDNQTFDSSLVDVDDIDGEVNTSTGPGTFLSLNSFELNLSNNVPGDLDNITVNGDLNSNATQFTFTFSGNNVGGDGCMFSGSGTGTRTGGDLSNLDPAFEASSTITAVALLHTDLNNFYQSVGAHTTNALRGGAQGVGVNVSGINYEGKVGMNAGDGGIPYGVWGNYTYTNFDNDLSSTAFDGHSHSILGGVDYAPIKGAVLGVSLGYGTTDVDTTFNRGNQENDTFTIAPYFGMLINDTWSIDATIGFSRVNTDQFRTAPGTTTQITSSPSADRWFGAMNLNGVTYINDWIIGGRVGVSRARNVTDSFVESNGIVVPKIINQLGTLSIGADVAHSFGKYEPFVSVTYENDYRITKISVISGPQPSNDTDDFLVGIGVRYFGDNNGLSGNLEWNKRLGRTNFDEYMINFSLRADF